MTVHYKRWSRVPEHCLNNMWHTETCGGRAWMLPNHLLREHYYNNLTRAQYKIYPRNGVEKHAVDWIERILKLDNWEVAEFDKKEFVLTWEPLPKDWHKFYLVMSLARYLEMCPDFVINFYEMIAQGFKEDFAFMFCGFQPAKQWYYGSFVNLFCNGPLFMLTPLKGMTIASRFAENPDDNTQFWSRMKWVELGGGWAEMNTMPFDLRIMDFLENHPKNYAEARRLWENEYVIPFRHNNLDATAKSYSPVGVI